MGKNRYRKGEACAVFYPVRADMPVPLDTWAARMLILQLHQGSSDKELRYCWCRKAQRGDPKNLIQFTLA